MTISVQRQLLPAYITSPEYKAKVLKTNPFALYMQNEGQGLTAFDSSPNGLDASYDSATMHKPFTSYFGDTGQRFSDSGYTDVFSAGFNTQYDPDEGCMLAWVRMDNGAIWRNGQQGFIVSLFEDGNNRVFMQKLGADDTIRFSRRANAASINIDHTYRDLHFFSLLLSWSIGNDELKAYLNGYQVGTTQSGLLASTGGGLSSTTNTIGAVNVLGDSSHQGLIAPVAFWNVPVTPAIQALGRKVA